jgi:2-polyprenyl-3-methyl-5-hydroxy-6-metoxy-1,4-benzoquinol methylase
MNVNLKDREPSPLIPCRLCGNEAPIFGTKKVREKYNVAYYECRGCGSLQTEEPYWLEEAYKVEGLDLDVGACQRCLNLSIEVSAALTVLGVSPEAACLDYGAGLGMFSRLMRDRGFNFFAYDKFIKPFFMDRFTKMPTQDAWSVLTAFEVFEHLVSPGRECAELFQSKPDMIFFTTQTWQAQGLDWWYIVPLGGQHVFFFSDRALQSLAAKYDYTLIDLPGVSLFLHNGIAKGEHKFSAMETITYHVNKSRWKKGSDLPTDISTRLHVLKDRKIMRHLAQNLFEKHQKDSFHWVERDFNALLRQASEKELP